MGILNEAGDKMLLGRQKSWPKGKSFSISKSRLLLNHQACTLVLPASSNLENHSKMLFVEKYLKKLVS